MDGDVVRRGLRAGVEAGGRVGNQAKEGGVVEQHASSRCGSCVSCSCCSCVCAAVSKARVKPTARGLGASDISSQASSVVPPVWAHGSGSGKATDPDTTAESEAGFGAASKAQAEPTAGGSGASDISSQASVVPPVWAHGSGSGKATDPDATAESEAGFDAASKARAEPTARGLGASDMFSQASSVVPPVWAHGSASGKATDPDATAESEARFGAILAATGTTFSSVLNSLESSWTNTASRPAASET